MLCAAPLFHTLMHMHSKQLCCKFTHTCHRNTTKDSNTCTHTHNCGTTRWHCELSAFYSSQAAVVGLKPPLSLSPSGCLLMRDAVKCLVTFSEWLKWSSRASYCGAVLLVLQRPTVQIQILYSSFHMIGSFMVFFLKVYFCGFIPSKKEHDTHFACCYGCQGGEQSSLLVCC